MTTRAVLDHQMEAFGTGSADEIIKDFADDAVLIRPEAMFKGREAIHGVYSEMFAGLFKPDTYDFEMVAEHVEGDYAYHRVAREQRHLQRGNGHRYLRRAQRQDRRSNLLRQNRSQITPLRPTWVGGAGVPDAARLD